MTRKQERAEARIQRARREKERNFQEFLNKLARRKIADPNDANNLHTSFCCVPQSLGMPLDEFMAAGQKLVGGAAVFFGRDRLPELIPDWECSASQYPHVLTAQYLNGIFDADGYRRGSRHRRAPIEFDLEETLNGTSSGSWT
jgi:hypothetical protein